MLRKQYESEKIYDHGLLKGTKRSFQEIAEEEKRKLKAVCGHHSYGIHQLFPQPSKYITMLREPVDRVISSYYFLRDFKGYEYVKEMTLEQFVQTHPEAQNLQTFLLSGLPPEKSLKKAKENLKNCKVVGLTERFDESVFLIKQELQWTNLGYKRLNVTQKRLIKQELPLSTICLIEKYNQLDIELYKLAKQL
ncbi:hypothetical protein AMD02_014015 [Halalkalibacterium halodurans]|nr:hypothetical protein AMD02_014015 [Halalkalibacterium halodurans]